MSNEWGPSKNAEYVSEETLPKNDMLELGEPILIASSAEETFMARLPRRGRIRVGRSPMADVTLPDAGVSREHLEIRLEGQVQVLDLGSSNGTFVNGRRLSPHQAHALAPGEAVMVAEWMLLVQTPASNHKLRSVWPHGYFEARVFEEIEQGRYSEFSLLRVRLPGGTHSEVAARELVELLPSDSLIGEYGPGELEALIRGVACPERLEEWAELLRRRLGIQENAGAVAFARYPAQAGSAAALMQLASDGLRDNDRKVDSTGHRLVVADPSTENLHRLVERIAPSNISVLLLGETGTGKEVIAETIHKTSPRRDQPFCRVNCAAFSEALLESEIFGHEKGAFTGAVSRKIGLLESAQGGTVFLDEIGDMPLSMQVKLLRVLEERRVTRVGSVESVPINVRFVAATHRNLEQRCMEGSFREDLFFRLNGITLRVPPLRERMEEVAHLADAFIDMVCERDRLSSRPCLTVPALELLKRHHWPGNIRELRNVIERAVALSTDSELRPEHFPLERLGAFQVQTPVVSSRSRWAGTDVTPQSTATHRTFSGRDADERQRIVDALNRTGGNQSRAAALLGISRRTLINRLDQYGLPRPRKPVGGK